MPQYRKLHTKTVESLDINDMPDDFTRLLWLLLPLIVCREGRGMDNPDWIKAKAMPLRGDVSAKRINEALAWYAGRGMVSRYAVEGRRYFQLVNWTRYQGDTSRESESNYPAQAENECANLLTTYSRPTHDLLTTNSCSYADAYTDADADACNATKPPKKQRTTKPAANIPPALQAFREKAHSFPNKATWETIAAAVGETAPALALWGSVVSGYIAMGWNPANVAGMLEFFKRGEIPAPRNGNGHNGNGKQKAPTSGVISYPGLDLDQSADFEFLRYNPNDPETPGIRSTLEAQGVNVSQLLQENPL